MGDTGQRIRLAILENGGEATTGQIMKRTGFSRSTVYRCIKNDTGITEVGQRPGLGKTWKLTCVNHDTPATQVPDHYLKDIVVSTQRLEFSIRAMHNTLLDIQRTMSTIACACNSIRDSIKESSSLGTDTTRTIHPEEISNIWKEEQDKILYQVIQRFYLIKNNLIHESLRRIFKNERMSIAKILLCYTDEVIIDSCQRSLKAHNPAGYILKVLKQIPPNKDFNIGLKGLSERSEKGLVRWTITEGRVILNG